MDGEGKVILAKDTDLRDERPLELDLAARASLPPGFPWRADQLQGHAVRGLLRTNRGDPDARGFPGA